MQIEEFTLERYQSLWENRVTYNLSESGVEPLSLRELMADADLAALLDRPLHYAQTNGLDELRATVASLYDGAGPENVLITTGSAEANFIATWALIEPGDEVVLMLPNYMQIWGLARAQGAKVRPWRLEEARRWAPDVAALDDLVTKRTRMIAICNPNNPTGAVMGPTELARVAQVAEEAGAVLYADEVYRGAERDGKPTSTCYGLTERVIVTGGLSKAYGLPGLRLGWLVGPEEFIARAWHHHDYTTISAATPSQVAALAALAPANRNRLLARARKLINESLPVLERWVAENADRVRMVPPRAGAMAFIGYEGGENSTHLAERARTEEDVLMVAGDCYGMDGYLRLGIGGRKKHLEQGLERLGRLFAPAG